MSLQLRLEPVGWVGGGGGAALQLYNLWSFGTVEESGRLTGPGLVPPDGPLVAMVLLAGGTIIQYEVGEAHLLQGPVKFPPHPCLPFRPSRLFLPCHEHKNGPIWRGS